MPAKQASAEPSHQPCKCCVGSLSTATLTCCCCWLTGAEHDRALNHTSVIGPCNTQGGPLFFGNSADSPCQALLVSQANIDVLCRLSTVRNADLTIVMADGRIAERGTHAALLTQQGIYAQLVRRQTDGGAPPLAEDTEDDEEVSCHVVTSPSQRGCAWGGCMVEWRGCITSCLAHPGSSRQAGILLFSEVQNRNMYSE